MDIEVIKAIGQYIIMPIVMVAVLWIVMGR